MYLLYRLHSWRPSEFYSMGYGERLITEAFLKQELEDMKREMGG